MLRFFFAALLLYDGAYSLLRNERGELLRTTVEDLFGERADHYLVAGLLGLAEMLLGVALLLGALKDALFGRSRP
jgi:hypothetical protein